MTDRNNPENQKPNGPHDLGQISKKTNLQHVLDTYRLNCSDDPNRQPLPFCVVQDYGTPNEGLIGNFSTWRNAMNYIERRCTDDDCHRLEIFEYTANFELTKEWTK